MHISMDNVYCVIHDLKPAQMHELHLQTAVLVPGAKYIPSHKTWLRTRGRAGWDGKAVFLNHDGRFLTGLLPQVLNVTGSIKIEDARPMRTLGQLTSAIQLRDYQQEAITIGLTNTYEQLWWPRGVFKCPTGSGKTRIAAAIIDSVNLRTLFLVHRKDLLLQTRDAFKEVGVTDVGIYGAGVHETNNLITIATVQSLYSAVKNRPEHLGFLNDIDQLFIDEAHLCAANLAKGNTFIDVCSLTPNAGLRWGLTATPNQRDPYSNQLLQGVSGKILYERSNADLIKEGYLTPPVVVMQRTPALRKLTGDWHEIYEQSIVMNTVRNNIIEMWATNVPKPALVMVQSEAHGHLLAARLNVPFLYGKTDIETRRAAALALRTGKLPLAVVSTIWDEGMDIPELQSLILAGGGKSSVKALQRVGRTLRKAKGKTQALIVDFYDHGHYFVKRHSEERLAIWRAEGFPVTMRNEDGYAA